jgi:ankyrin repeat protein
MRTCPSTHSQQPWWLSLGRSKCGSSLRVPTGRQGAYEALRFAFMLRDADASLLLLEKVTSLQPDSDLLVAAVARSSPDTARRLQRILLAKLQGAVPPDEPPWSFVDALNRPDFCSSDDDAFITIVKRLIALGIGVDHPAERSLNGPQTPLQIAVDSGDVFLARSLISQGAHLPPNRTLNADLLVAAASTGNSAGIESLLQQTTDPNKADYRGKYALPEALAQGNQRVAHRLIDAHADVTLSGTDQNSPLTIAARRNWGDMVSLLTNKGADINKHDAANEYDSAEDWPLRAAARAGSLDTLAQLIAMHADVNATDSVGRSVLHDFLYVENSDPTIPGTIVTLNPMQISAVAQLKGANFDFSKHDSAGRSVLASNIERGYSSGIPGGGVQYNFLTAFANAGAKIDADALFFAVDQKDDLLVTWILNHGGDPNAVRDGTSLLYEAFDIQSSPKTGLALLKGGANVPGQLDSVLPKEIKDNQVDVVALLVKKGANPNFVTGSTVAESQTSLDIALNNGSPEIVKLIVSAGVDPNQREDDQEQTALHKLVQRDVDNATTGSVVLMPKVQEAIGVLVESGFDLASTNKQGLTVLQIANQQPSTHNRLIVAIGLANSPGTELHRAVRDDDPSKVEALLKQGVDINIQDALHRTPLTLALQLHHTSVVELLLRRGAEVTYVPRAVDQTADIEFAIDPDLASAFAVRLLSQQLLALQPTDIVNPTTSINEFVSNQSMPIPGITWNITCTPCTGNMVFGDNLRRSGLSPIESRRMTRDQSTYFELVQYNIAPVPFPNPLSGQLSPQDFIFTATGSLTIPACRFDFVYQATCYPGVSIEVDPADMLMIRARDGSAIPEPATPLTVVQNGTSTTVAPGTKAVFDRSLGSLQINVGPVESKIFSLGFSASFVPGPSTDIKSDLDPSSRIDTYSRIAALQTRFEQLSNSQDKALAIEAKNIATAMHMLSLRAVDRQYFASVKQLFAIRAKDVLAMNDQMVDLRNAIIANSSMTADQIDVLIAKIDLLLPGLSADQKVAATQIRDELEKVKSSVAGTNSSIRIFQEKFRTQIPGSYTTGYQ